MAEKKKYELSDAAKQHKAEYIKGYKKRFYILYSLRCHKDYDKDIVDYLNSTPNKSEAIKAAVREAAKKHG